MLQELAPCASGSAFSLLFPVAGRQFGYGCCEDGGGGQQVDCTLSLGTPSTRRAQQAGVVHGRRTGAGVSWQQDGGSPAGRCANCDTTSTPLWRNGPRGPKSLCNACGIRYKKEERRAAAALAPLPAQDTALVGSYACGAAYARQHQHHPPLAQWGRYGSSVAKKSASFAAYGGDAAGADGSWMVNVMPSSPAFAVRERPTQFQYYY